MTAVPPWPRLLGLAGLLPQLACAIIAWMGPAQWHEPSRVIGALYAALILTFLGGTWWGIAAAAPAAERRGGLAWLWIAAVIPSLFAWAILSLSYLGELAAEAVLVMLGAGILVALGVDWRIGPLAPRWWMQLRAPLSLLLGIATIALGLA